MTEPVQLAIPCRMVSLIIELGPQSGFTVLEDLVAQALLAGRGERDADPADRQHDVDSLAELFAVPSRIMLNVLHTLWSDGQIYIDFDTGRIGLADAAREKLTSCGRLDGVAVRREKRSFLFEPITGRFFKEREGTRRPEDGSLHMPRHDGIDERDLSPSELLRAVQRVFREERRRGVHQTVLSVGFGNPILQPANEDRWLHSIADVRVDPATGRLSVYLREHLMWGRRAVRVLSDHLADLADTEPDLPFVQSLRGRARHELVPTDTVERMLADLDRTVTGLADTEPSQLKLRQDVLTGLVTGIRRGLAAMDDARAATTVVTGSAGHRWTFEDLLAAARTQVVIVTPSIQYGALNPMLPALRQALDRGVHVVVLWGRTETSMLDNRVRSAFADLAGRQGASLLIADRSTKTAACLVIQDDSRALVSSQSVLTMEQAANRGEVGVLFGPADDGPGRTAAVTELLRWARNQYPYWAMRKHIKAQPEDFRPDDGVPVRSSGRSVEPALPPEGVDPDTAAVRLWADSWADFQAMLLRELARLRAGEPVIEVVANGAQYDAMWEAVRTATGNVVISADSLDGATTEVMSRVLEDRARAGATIQIVQPDDLRATTAAPLSRLTTGYGKAVRVSRRPVIARLVVADGQSILGSFSPLADPARTVAVPLRRSSQLGVRVHDVGFASQMAAAIGCPLNSRTPGTSTLASPAAPTRDGIAAARTILMEARQHRPSGRFGAVVAEQLSLVNDPWLVLQEWREVGVPAEEIRVAAAALVREPGSTPAPERAIWIDWLIEDAWERGAFIEAAALGGLIDDERGGSSGMSDGVSSACCLAAASLESGPLGPVLADVALALSELPKPDRIGGAAGALAEILLWAGIEGVEALRLLVSALPESWQDVAELAMRLNEGHRRPAPLSEIVHELSTMVALAEANRNWASLAEEVGRLSQLRQRFKFKSGERMHDLLFAEDGMLTYVLAAASGGQVERTALSGMLPSDMRQYLDEMLTREGYDHIEWSRQMNYLDKIRKIVQQARRLVAANAVYDQYLREDAELEPYRDIAGLVAATWEALYADARAVPRPHSFPLLALLTRLEPLTTWARIRE